MINNATADRISSRSFISVTRKRDIQKARIMSVRDRNGLANGASDVHLESPLGEKKTISRKELMQNYVYLSGRKIRISGWKANRDYYVVREDNTRALAVQIPRNYRIRVNERVTNSSKGRDYIVCLLGADNTIDRSTASIVSRDLFRKMFTIQRDDFTRFCNDRGYRVRSKREDNEHVLPKKASYNNTIKTTGEVRKIPPVETRVVQANTQRMNRVQNSTKAQSMSTAYEAVGRLINSEGKILGFVIKDGRGMTKQVSKQEMTVLCNKKLVSNLSLATREGTGTKYLRGNGIKISDLPSTVI